MNVRQDRRNGRGDELDAWLTWSRRRHRCDGVDEASWNDDRSSKFWLRSSRQSRLRHHLLQLLSRIRTRRVILRFRDRRGSGLTSRLGRLASRARRRFPSSLAGVDGGGSTYLGHVGRSGEVDGASAWSSLSERGCSARGRARRVDACGSGRCRPLRAHCRHGDPFEAICEIPRRTRRRIGVLKERTTDVVTVVHPGMVLCGVIGDERNERGWESVLASLRNR